MKIDIQAENINNCEVITMTTVCHFCVQMTSVTSKNIFHLMILLYLLSITTKTKQCFYINNQNRVKILTLFQSKNMIKFSLSYYFLTYALTYQVADESI